MRPSLPLGLRAADLLEGCVFSKDSHHNLKKTGSAEVFTAEAVSVSQRNTSAQAPPLIHSRTGPLVADVAAGARAANENWDQLWGGKAQR